MKHALRFADGSDDVIEGLLVPFNSPFPENRDTYGTIFSNRTNFQLGWYGERPFLYHHGQDPDVAAERIGTIRSLEIIPDLGVWMRAQVDKHNQYYNALVELIGEDKLGLSSGSIDYLVEINPRSGHVDQWPIAEGSLTPTSANPYAAIAGTSFRSAAGALDTKLAEHLTENAGIVTAEAVWSGQFPATPASANQGPGSTETPAARAAETSLTERSYEDIRDDIGCLLNPSNPFGFSLMTWTYVVATYPDHVIVCRCEDGDEDSYWSIPYTLDDSMEPVLDMASAEQMQQAFVPASARAATTPLTMDAQRLSIEAATLTARTKDLGERRYREGRVLSSSNRQTLQTAHTAMGEAHTALGQFLDQTAKGAEDAARANDPATWQGQEFELELLSIYADCI